MSTEEQLISFFAYSMFIYPVSNYLVSPKRQYPRWKGALYAILFLAAISGLHIIYENREKGPNYHQLLGVPRGDPLISLKKAYKKLSLELHPDKVYLSLSSYFTICIFQNVHTITCVCKNNLE